MLGSLRSRLALSNLAITLVALSILTVVFGQLLRQHGIDVARNGVGRQTNQLRNDVNLVLRRVAQDPKFATAAPGALFDYLVHDSQVLGKRVIFYSVAGQCAFDSAHFPKAPPSAAKEPGCSLGENYSQWLVTSVSTRRPASEFVRIGQGTYLLTQRPAKEGAIVLVTDASEIIPSWTAIAPAFYLSAVAAAIIWLLMAIFFGYTVSRPLRKVSGAARAIAEGDYSQTVEVPGGGEIGELGSSFNHMVTQVRAANQLLKDFVANVSHDLRTPITLISGYAGSVLDGTAEQEVDVRDAVQVIYEESFRMQRLVDDLLQLTRLEGGLKQFDRSPVAIPQLVERTIRRVTAAMPGRTIVNVVAPAIPLAYGDEELLERVLINLMGNALQYTPSDGTVKVSAEERAGWIEVCVSDTGIGITSEDQARVFERFYRVDRGRSRDNGHTGLGLPIVREIVEAHGGEVTVDSTPGSGATFRFTVPRFPPESTRPAAAERTHIRRSLASRSDESPGRR
jgi:signal transduction histidine kinase